VGQHELDRDSVVQVDVMRRDHNTHTSRSQHLVDAVLARQDISFPYPSNLVLVLHADPSVGRVASGLQGRMLQHRHALS
jgi:hypothetical protein